jgi:hypothetical protein
VLGVSLAALAVVVVPLLPVVWRIRARARRLGSGGRTPEDAAARTLAAWQEITDTAWDHGIPPDESQTPRKTAARIVRLGKLEGEAADAVHRVSRAVEQVLYAPEPRPGTGLTDDARLIRDGLRDAASRGTRLRALLTPRSSVRVMWVLSARWAALMDRWSVHRRRLDGWASFLRRPSRPRG